MKLQDALEALNHEVDHGGATRRGDRFYPRSKRSEHIIDQLRLLGDTEHLPLEEEPAKAVPAATRVATAPARPTPRVERRPLPPRPHGDPKAIMQDFKTSQRQNQPTGQPSHNRSNRPNGQQKKHGLHKPRNGAPQGQRQNQPAGQNRGPRPNNSGRPQHHPGQSGRPQPKVTTVTT